MNVSTRDDGFTLIEVLIATMLTAVILTVLVASFLVFYKNTSYIGGRDDHAAGAEVLSSYLNRDLASATAFSSGATLTSCPSSSPAQKIMALTWTDYGKPSPAPSATAVPGDIDPSPNGTTYTATYTLEHDTDALATSSTCMIKRTYSGGTTLVLIHGLANAGITKPTTSASCVKGTTVVITLNRYQSTTQSDASADYTYVGCLKARTNAL
jgi:prepilin-type N-terminal cleavage/methylation domain-containing protein